jgi:hypothetical protein
MVPINVATRPDMMHNPNEIKVLWLVCNQDLISEEYNRRGRAKRIDPL